MSDSLSAADGILYSTMRFRNVCDTAIWKLSSKNQFPFRVPNNGISVTEHKDRARTFGIWLARVWTRCYELIIATHIVTYLLATLMNFQFSSWVSSKCSNLQNKTNNPWNACLALLAIMTLMREIEKAARRRCLQFASVQRSF